MEVDSAENTRRLLTTVLPGGGKEWQMDYLGTKIEVRLTRLEAMEGREIVINRAGICMEGPRKEECKKRDKLEVGDHDSRSDSSKSLIG
jgi:hypothetical protein